MADEDRQIKDRLLAELQERRQKIEQMGGKDILVIGGGIIPKRDVPKLKEAGIAQIFGPGTPIDEISNFIRTNLASREE